MEKETEELTETILKRYREIDELILTAWKDGTGLLLHSIVSEECGRIGRYMQNRQEQKND